jgi:hypothetical protein
MITNSNKKQHEREESRLRKEPGLGTSTAGVERSVGLINHAHASWRVKEKDGVSFLMNSTLQLALFDQAASVFLPSFCPINFARGLSETPCATRLKNSVNATIIAISRDFPFGFILYSILPRSAKS